MKIENIRYMFDVSNGEFTITLSDDKYVSWNCYNDGNVFIGTDVNNDIVCIRIVGFREYASGLIDEYIKKAVAPLMR